MRTLLALLLTLLLAAPALAVLPDEVLADPALEARARTISAQVMQYLVDRYGEFVLLKPVFAPHTLVLWAAAPLVLVVGGIAIAIGVRRKRGAAVPEAELTADEQRALDELRG